VATDVPSEADVGALNWPLRISLGSRTASLFSATVTVADVEFGAKVIVLLSAV
jgi:hypothetical protein